MFQIEIDDDDLDATFYCPFCDTKQDWPFGGRILWGGTGEQRAYPDAGQVIVSHFIGDWGLKKFGFSACEKIPAWRNTEWVQIAADSGNPIDGGTVEMRDQFPYVKRREPAATDDDVKPPGTPS